MGKKVNYCETDDLNSNYPKSWWPDVHQVVSLDHRFLKPLWPLSHCNCDTHKYACAGPDLSPPSWPLARPESPYLSCSGILHGCTHSGQWIMLPLQDLLSPASPPHSALLGETWSHPLYAIPPALRPNHHSLPFLVLPPHLTFISMMCRVSTLHPLLTL